MRDELARAPLLVLALRASLWVAAATALYGPGTPAQAEWAAIAEQKTSYTTDAFQFSSARRLRFSDDPSQPTVVSIDKPQDVIWEPAVELIQATNTSLGSNELSVKAQGAILYEQPHL